MAKYTKASTKKKMKDAETLIAAEKHARHSEEHPAHAVSGNAPAAATLLGLHPAHADGEGTSGSPGADLEREQTEERGDNS
jgi:hypothetical protein